MKTTIIICENCYNEFMSSRSDAKYCSNACKQRTYLERLKIHIPVQFISMPAVTPELPDKLKKLEDKLNELIKSTKLKNQQEHEQFSNSINKTFEELKNIQIEGKAKEADRMLQKWLTMLLEFDEHEEIATYKIKSFCKEIIRSCISFVPTFPDDYKYLSFINFTLVPRVKEWYDKMRYSREGYLSIDLSAALRSKFACILQELD